MTTQKASPFSEQPRSSSLVTPKRIGVGILLILAVWFILGNTDSTKIRFWLVELDAPTWLTLAGTFLAGLVTGWLIRASR